jgi:hypothetical protein
MAEARTWILVEDGEEGRLKVKLVRSATGAHGRTVEIRIPVRLKMPPIDGDARRYGAKLHSQLCQDEDLKLALSHILTAQIGETFPLCFRIEVDDPTIESRLQWETLYVDGYDFLALRPQWPIARVVDNNDNARVYRAPLRIVAVMSAAGVSAMQEWQGIYDAIAGVQQSIREGRRQTVPIHLTAIVGEQELLNHLRSLVDEQRASGGPVWLTVLALEDEDTIEQCLLKAPPHILHFFCHGSLLYGDWALTFATLNDREAAARRGADIESVRVKLDRLQKLVVGRDLWFVSINSCSGGVTGRTNGEGGPTQGLAQAVVEAGAGAALGWRTPVTVGDAHILSRSVYAALLGEIHRMLDGAQVDTKARLELAGLGYAVRARLAEEHPDLLRWTLPVLFVAQEPLSIMLSSLEPDDATNLETDQVSANDLSDIESASFNQTLEPFHAVPGLDELITRIVQTELAKQAALAPPAPPPELPKEPLPDLLQANAWVDHGTQTPRSAPVEEGDWATDDPGVPVGEELLFAEERPNAARWQEVGWGLVLPDVEGPSAADKALAKDAPEPIQRLLAARPGSSVFRYRPDLGASSLMLYERSGVAREVAVVGGDEGRREREMPMYLLIVGSPTDIPWQLQFVLNMSYCVGRLDLDETGLDRYVSALLDDWRSCTASRRSVLTWAVDRGRDDITWTMRHALAEPLHACFMKDDDVESVVHHAAGEATHDALASSLSGHPGLIVTTSHGATPVGLARDDLRAALGRPVDQTGAWLTDDVLDAWRPEGAIWYAHACCSAGADHRSAYQGLVDEGSDVDLILRGVTAAGACTAPLPRRLLGCDRPLRAFIGHVEPTFNWTLRDPDTGQPLTSSLRDALYAGLYQQVGEPIGLAMRKHYTAVGSLWGMWDAARTKMNTGEAVYRRRATKARVAALDRQSVVILGDPTVTVPQD